jgi:hypothetical protein
MKEVFHKILFVIAIAVLVLILVQTMTGFIKIKPLNGAVVKTEMPKLTYNNYANSSFQRDFENYCRANFGFREFSLRLYNQHLWDFYRTTRNKTVVIGRSDWLFGKREARDYYISGTYDYTNDTMVMKRQFYQEALRLYKVQNILEEYNTFIFTTLLPGKTFVFNEYLPENPGPYMKPFHAVYYFAQVFDSLGINYIDLQKDYEYHKDKTDYPLFPKTGMHWTYIAAEHSFDSILRYIEHKTDINLHNYTIGEKYIDKPHHPDTDLEDVLNLLRPIRPNTNYYADVTVDDDTTATRPVFILVGDSYFWNINNSIPLHSIFSKYAYWYYNSTIYFNPSCNHTSKIDILEELINTDIINLSYSPRQLYVFSNKFLPKALLYLTHDDSEIDSTLQVIASSVKKDTDEERLKDAKDILFADPEKYFPDLGGSDIPTTRNKRINDIIINNLNK